MFPLQLDAMRMETIMDLRRHYALPDEVWDSFVQVAGDPGQHMRLLAVLPNHVVSAALERAQLHDGQFLRAVQASHVGLVCNLAKRIQHTRSGGDWDLWAESSPFGDQKSGLVGAIALESAKALHPSETRRQLSSRQ